MLALFRTWLLIGCGFDLSKPGRWTKTLIVLQVREHRGVAPECARCKQGIVCGQDEVASAANLDQRRRGGRLQVLVVAAEKLEAQQVIARNEALNLIENSERVERTEFRLEIVRLQPHGVAIGFAGLCAAGLAHVGTQALAKRNQR